MSLEWYRCEALHARISAATCAANKRRSKKAREVLLRCCERCPGVRKLAEAQAVDTAGVRPLDAIESVAPQREGSRSRKRRYEFGYVRADVRTGGQW